MACEAQRWHLRLAKLDGSKALSVPFRCRSWRHEGECRRARAAVDYRRIQRAFTGIPGTHVVYLVLGLDQAAEQRAHRTRWDLFGEWKDRWRSLAKAIRRTWGDLSYVMTMEVHRSGWPHANVMMVCPGLAWALRTGNGRSRTIASLRAHAQACGFGRVLNSNMLVRDVDAVGSYIVKIASTLEDAYEPGVSSRQVAEVVKLSQLPEEAPSRFRRLRASKGFLPPVKEPTDWTGELVQAPVPEPTPPPEWFAALVSMVGTETADVSALERMRASREATLVADLLARARARAGPAPPVKVPDAR